MNAANEFTAPPCASSFASDLLELMTKFDAARAEWIKHFGSDAGFNEWFSKQVGL